MITAQFLYINKFHARMLDDVDDVEYIVTPKNVDNMIYIFTNLDFDESSKQFTCDIRIVRSSIEEMNMQIVLDDEIVYKNLKKNDPIRYNCDLCFSELVNYLIEE